MHTWIAIVAISAAIVHPTMPERRHAQATPVAVVERLYRDYAWELDKRSSTTRTGLLDESPAVLEQYFDDRLTQLLRRDKACRVRTKEVCKLSGSPIWDSNDPAAFELSISAAHNRTMVTVAFRRRDPSPEGTSVTLIYRMVQTTRGWRVQDIVRVDGGSLLRTLTAG